MTVQITLQTQQHAQITLSRSMKADGWELRGGRITNNGQYLLTFTRQSMDADKTLNELKGKKIKVQAWKIIE